MLAMLVEIPEDPDLDSDNVGARTWKWGGAQIINQQNCSQNLCWERGREFKYNPPG